MPEWWSYGLSDFLLFSPRTYYRMLERYNEALWPGQILTLGLGALIVGVVRRPSAWQGRVVSAVLAILWTTAGWAFVFRRYATINWAARYLLPLFAVEVLLLLWIGTVQNRLTFRPSRAPAAILGQALLLCSIALYPLLAPLLGRSWHQAEVFGVAPDPTAVATLGLVLLVSGRARWELMAVPLIWCLISALTLWAMKSAGGLAPAGAALLTMVGAALRPSRREP